MAGNTPNVSYTSFDWSKLNDLVVLQQGVPIPDNDWNEADAIALANMTMLIADVFGDLRIQPHSGGKSTGLPYGIAEATSPSLNFEIQAGWALVKGVLVPTVMGDPPTAHDYEDDTNYICSGTITTVSSPNITDTDKNWTTDYSLANCRMKMTSGAESGNTFTIVSRVSATELQLSSVGSIAPTDTYIIKPPVLTTAGLLGRTDEVYLAVWWEDINENEDSSIVNPGLGVETTHRSRRRWCVRVAEGGSTPTSSTRHGFGFRYMTLATLVRTGLNITEAMITNEDNILGRIDMIGPDIKTWLDEYYAEPVAIDQAALTPAETGTHTGFSSSDNLVDSTKSWTTDEWVGRTIVNVTDGFTARITANTATGATTENKKGGSERDWDNGDSYQIFENEFQLTGTFYVGKGPSGTAGRYFSARDANDPGEGFYEGVVRGKGSGVYFDVYDSTNTTLLNPAVDADDNGFYTDPYLRAYRDDRPASNYEAVINTGTKIVCYQRKARNLLSNEPAYAFPLAGLTQEWMVCSGMAMRQLDGDPDTISTGVLATVLEDLLAVANDRVRKDLADTITASHTFDSVSDSKGQLWVSKWVGMEASTPYDGFGTEYYPDATSKYDYSNNNFGFLLDEVGDFVFFSEFLPSEYESGERLVIHSYFRLKNAETASNKIYARLHADIFSDHDTAASVSDTRSVPHNIGSNNAANTVHEVIFVVNNSNLRPLDVCKFRVMLYDVISGDAVTEAIYLGSRVRYRANKIAQAFTSWPSEG